MPMYDYRCPNCGARWEAWQKFSDDPIRVCPQCGGPAQRVIHAPAINFKGSGFYITDSKGGSSASEAASPAPAAEQSEAPAAKAETKPTETAKPAVSGGDGSSSVAKPAAAPSTN